MESAIRLTDLPNKDDLLTRLREGLGVPPEDEDPAAKQARQDAAAQQQAEAAAIQKAQAEATIAKTQADAQKAGADAQKSQAQAQNEALTAMGTKIDMLVKLIEAAALVQQAPGTATTADELAANIDPILNLNNQPLAISDQQQAVMPPAPSGEQQP